MGNNSSDTQQMLQTNKPELVACAAVDVVSSVAVVFKPFVIKIRHDDELRRGLTNNLLYMVDQNFRYYTDCINNSNQND